MDRFEDKISAMIPDYLNGHLSEADRKLVEDSAANNSVIAADLEFQSRLKDAVKTPRDEFEPGDLDWARLSKAMTAEPQNLSLGMSDVANDRAGTPKFWRYAAVLLAVLAIGQAGVLGSIAINESSEPQYVTVSEAVTSSYSSKVGFVDNLTVKEMNEIVFLVGGNIISGPSALGLYDIDFSSKEACDEAYKMLQLRAEKIETISLCN